MDLLCPGLEAEIPAKFPKDPKVSVKVCFSNSKSSQGVIKTWFLYERQQEEKLYLKILLWISYNSYVCNVIMWDTTLV